MPDGVGYDQDFQVYWAWINDCADDCEDQTPDCETFRMPNPFGAKKAETYGVPAVASPTVNAVQVSSTLFYSVCALLVVLVTANVTCLVMQTRVNRNKKYEPVNYDSSA